VENGFLRGGTSSARCTAHSRSSTTGACGSGGSILVSKDAPEKGLSNGGS
jgi:hypothetical protein